MASIDLAKLKALAEAAEDCDSGDLDIWCPYDEASDPATVLALVRVVEAALAVRRHRREQSSEPAFSFEHIERDFLSAAAELDIELSASLAPFGG